MKKEIFLPVVALVILSTSCRKQPAEVEISETRELTSLDREPAVGATTAEQFLPPEILQQIQDSGQSIKADGQAMVSPWTYQLPAADWKLAEKKPLRDINLTFGEGAAQGEVYLSVVGGGLQPNVDRWFRQFGNPPQSLSEMGRLEFLGRQGYLVEAAGRYEPGMGRSGQDGQALLGAIVEKDERLVTVKMIGPQAEVPGRRQQFIEFVASLQRN